MTFRHTEGSIELAIQATHYCRGYHPTREDPGEPEHFEELRVFVKDIEITDALEPKLLDEYHKLALEALHEQREEWGIWND